jgi:uncharacterized protein
MGCGGYHTLRERPATIALLHQYVHGETLIKHCIATGAIIRAVAGYLSEDPALWEEIGILHDIDFECVSGGRAAARGREGTAVENRRYYG